MEVLLEDDARIDLEPDDVSDLRNPRGPTKNIRVAGTGDFRGFVLARRAASRWTTAALMGQFDLCSSKECSGWKSLNWVSTNPDFYSNQVLKRGKYRLYLIGSGATELNLTFPGLTGRMSVEATGPVKSVVASSIADISGPVAATDLMDLRSSGTGVSLTVIVVHAPDSGGTVGFCRYKGEPEGSLEENGPACGELGAYDHDEVIQQPGSDPSKIVHSVVPIVDYGMVRGRFRDGCWYMAPVPAESVFCGSVLFAY